MLRRALRTDEDLTDFYTLAEKDDILRQTARELCGMHTVAWPELFPALVLAVTLQMAPMKRSNQMMDLLMQGFGENAVFDGKNVRYWPSTKKISSTPPKELQEKAKLGYRAKNLVAIAAALEAWFPTMDELYAMDTAEAKETLMSLFGIGNYSAELVMLGMGFPLDVWSAKIFGILFHGKVPENPCSSIVELMKIGRQRWDKWAGLAFFYILNDLPRLSKRVNVDLTGYWVLVFSVLISQPFLTPQPQRRQHDGQDNGRRDYCDVRGSELAYAKKSRDRVWKRSQRRNYGQIEYDDG